MLVQLNSFGKRGIEIVLFCILFVKHDAELTRDEALSLELSLNCQYSIYLKLTLSFRILNL